MGEKKSVFVIPVLIWDGYLSVEKNGKESKALVQLLPKERYCLQEKRPQKQDVSYLPWRKMHPCN